MVYNIVDPPDANGKQLGILPHGTLVAFGWDFGVAWRYTVLEAELVVRAINACFEDKKRQDLCCAMTVKYERAAQAAMEAAALVSRLYQRKVEAKRRNKGLTLEQRILARLERESNASS